MSQKYEKLKTLLQELFQLDQPDLDFGLYRIMHAKSAEVTQFLDRDLLPQVKAAFALYKTADKAEIERELAKAIDQAQGLGMDPEAAPKVKELRERLAGEAVDVEALESEVYDHLFSFFRRYYSEGDFLSKRVYKPGVYAIPYEGEEVKLHWANADQYYIKTSEYLRDYAFRLRPADEKNPMRVHFRLVDAAEGEHGNVKETQGKERRFRLAEVDPIGLDGGELVVRFTYQPNPAKQAELNAASEAAILEAADPQLVDWIRELRAPHQRADGAEGGTRLRVHLDRYTARNTFDYFIHKDLGGFLRRELDFYIKNEVMHLDDIESESSPRVEQHLSKIKVIRRIAGKVIDFLVQLENFQKKLWLKKKFVVETFWCVTLKTILAIPEEAQRTELLGEIAANKAQHDEWVDSFAIDEIVADLTRPGYSQPLSVDFLVHHPTLVVDTRHFDESFCARLLSSVGDLDSQTDGLLIQSENFQALRFLEKRYRDQVKCIYIDPPYNAKTSEILYKNTYKHASWLSLMNDRVEMARQFMTHDGVFVCAIDENEQERLGLLLDQIFPADERVCISVVHNPRGIQGAGFSFTHENAYFVHAPGLSLGLRMLDDAKSKPLMKTGSESERPTGKNCFYPIIVHQDQIVGFGDVPPDGWHPDAAAIRRDDGTTELWPISSTDNLERKWRYARQSIEGVREQLQIRSSRDGIPVVYLAKDYESYRTVWSEAQFNAAEHGSTLLKNILGEVGGVSFPKSIWTVWHALQVSRLGSEDVALDFFAGSGTTAHAVTRLNQEDGGRRKFVLVEMEAYFETALLPRLKKVTYSPEWKDGKPRRVASPEEAERSPRMMKVVRLESYEDALNNLEIRRTDTQRSLLDVTATHRQDGFREEYLLRYMLDVEARGSRSLLNIEALEDPGAYQLRVKTPGSDENREVEVDLLETFNYLIGLRVRYLAAPQRVTAAFRRDNDPELPDNAPRRLLLEGRLKESADGRWWFRSVLGTVPDGRRVLVIWRNRPGGADPEGIAQDNLVLDAWFRRQGYSSNDQEVDLIYVNGDNNLENVKGSEETWKVRLIDESIHQLMFESEEP